MPPFTFAKLFHSSFRQFKKASRMKNILVPTDFSVFANYAFDTAVLFAKRFNSRIHLLHQLSTPNTTPAAQEQAIKNAQVLLNNLKDKQPELDIRISVSTGKLPTLINQFIADHGVDLIVMGSHGASGWNELLIGSNTQKVIREVSCPVLVIKKQLTDIKFDKVVFASSFHKDETAAFMRMKEFVAPFIPEIHLVEIHTSSLFDPPYFLSKETLAQFKELCKPFHCETHIERDFSIEKGIRSFAQDIKANLIVISNHQKNPLKRIFSGSNVEALVNHADLPVLSIDFR
jgi:nucleotide-binding universal stress UspA family protein